MDRYFTASQIAKLNLFKSCGNKYWKVLKTIEENKDILKPKVSGDKKFGTRIYINEKDIKKFLQRK